MLTTLKNAFKMKELRKKIFYTFAMLVVIRLGSQLPVPGVDRTYFSRWFAAQTGDAFNFFDDISLYYMKKIMEGDYFYTEQSFCILHSIR